MSDRREQLAEKLRIAPDMFGLGESIMRRNLRRAYPDASESEKGWGSGYRSAPEQSKGTPRGRLRGTK